MARRDGRARGCRALLHRPGSLCRGCVRCAGARRLDRLYASGSWTLHRQGRGSPPHDGRTLRQDDGKQSRQGRLDAHHRCSRWHARRESHRWHGRNARGGCRTFGQSSQDQPGRGGVFWGRWRQYRRCSRSHEPRSYLETPSPLRLRKQRVRASDSSGVRGFRSAHR